MNKVAIVVVDFNGHKDTLDFLDSAMALQIEDVNLKTIIIDNGSEKPLPQEIEKKYSFLNVEVLQTGVNKGFAGGYNFGMKYAFSWGANYILIINNDTLIGDANLINKLTKVIEKDKEIGMVSPKIYFAKGYEFYKNRYKPKNKGNVIWYAGGFFDKNNALTVHRGIDEVNKGLYDGVEEIDFISGCCLLVRTSMLAQIGFFRENLFAYFEDVDLVLRAKQAGYKIYYCGKAYLYHKVSRTSGIGSPFSDYLLTRNRLYIGMMYLPFRTRFALLREAFRLFYVGRKEQKMAILDFLKGEVGPPPWTKKDVQKKRYPLELSIVIVNYKTASLTIKLLETIFDSKSGFNKNTSEVIVLDNASGDNVGTLIKKRFPKTKFIQNKENTGFSRGYNKAISYSKGEYILMLNSDIEVLPKSLNEILVEAKRRNDKAVVVGKLFLDDGTVQNSCFRLPTVIGAIKEYLFNIEGEYNMYDPKIDVPKTIEGAVMACFLIPKLIWNEVGELSEGSFMYFEDIEYCRRLKQKGFKLYYCPKAIFIHHHGASAKKIGNQAYEYLKKGSIFYHGRLKYFLLWIILWLGQKINKHYRRSKKVNSQILT